MAQEVSAPATKQDIGLLMERMGTFEDRMGSLETRVTEWREEMFEWKEEVKEHFNLVAENLRYDLVGIYKDRTEDHEQRIRRLERKTGVVA